MTEPVDDVLWWARALQAVAQSGLHYATTDDFAGDEFDVERYREVADIAARMMAATSETTAERIRAVFDAQVGHATPKLDVRGAVFDDQDRVLLVRERLDGGRWTLPGGWADVNETPSVAVAREVREETGYVVRATRLLALFDRDQHDHPPHPFHTWKVFFDCEIVGGDASPTTLETDEPTFWPVADLPELSADRVTAPQLRRLLELHHAPTTGADFD